MDGQEAGTKQTTQRKERKKERQTDKQERKKERKKERLLPIRERRVAKEKREGGRVKLDE